MFIARDVSGWVGRTALAAGQNNTFSNKMKSVIRDVLQVGDVHVAVRTVFEHTKYAFITFENLCLMDLRNWFVFLL